MAATVTIDRDHNLAAGFHLYYGRIAFDDAYVTGGEPIDADDNLRFDLLIAQPEGGYVFEWVESTQALKVLTALGAHSHNLLLKGGQAAATTERVAYYATDIFGKEAATDRTILGADSATKGGVLASTAAVAAEVASLTDLSVTLAEVRFFAVGA